MKADECVNCVQFDSGLFTTAAVVDSAYKLAAAAKSALSITEVSRLIVRSLSCPHVNSLT